MNSRTQWGSFSAVNAELLNRELVSRWISASNGVHSTKTTKSSPEHGNIDADYFSAVEMNSRVQWVSFSHTFSIPSPEWIPAPNGVHYRARPTTLPSSATVPSRHPQCTWRDECPRPMGFILVQQRMQRQNLNILNAKVTGKVFPWSELPRQMGFIPVHQ